MNAIKSNCHTHTNYCDGRDTAEAMIRSAINKGFTTLGFSGHCPMNIESDWAMMHEGLELYYSEIQSLKEKYKNEIEILCGIELDADAEFIKEYQFDYVISSVHQIHKGGRIYSVDYTAEELSTCAEKEYSGDWNKLAQEYFESVADLVIKEKTDVVGHFDLITKFNDPKPLFDEADAEYQKCALRSVDRILSAKPNMIFEVNTGAMFRMGNTKPYPASFILEHIKEKGGRVTVTSDSHQVESVDFAFDKAREHCKNCGFDEIWHLTSEGFIPEKI